ncbi:hypothetical protein K458DRAFT_362610 [Lentithecium fluviatile CBS 122367]|uniref:CHAT domain-containing protein n=1 Tax=Lentithecium fluviatile CBS 122367 TaxID=1168545 RepID=A0A6G1J8M7_9PLEO|nr:hypothetical protein K458DRAFT_362610 [Lentithecium fluviatile CBS 122367]
MKKVNLYKASTALRRRYRQDRSDKMALFECIEFAQKAVEQSNAKSPAIQATRWFHLGVVLQEKYLHTRKGSLNDLIEAIACKERSLRIMPADTSADVVVRRFLGTGVAWSWRYQAAREGNPDAESETYFNTAREHYTKALEVSKEGTSNRAAIFDSMGVLFRDRYYEMKRYEKEQLSDLEKAISLLEDALIQTPKSQYMDEKRLRLYDILGCVKGNHYQALQTRPKVNDLLAESFRFCQLAADGTPKSNRSRAERLSNLGIAYQDRYLRSKKAETSDLDKELELYEDALGDAHGPALIRMKAVKEAMDASIETQRWAKAVAIAEEMLELLAQLTHRTHSTEDLEGAIRSFSGLGSVAASVFLKAGKSDLEALQILEKGSSIIHSLTMDIQSNDSEPDTGKLQNIPSESQLLDLASEGPIVCFNVTYLSSHAFLITKTQIRSLELDKLTLRGVEDCIKAMASGYGSSRAKFVSYTLNGVTHSTQSTSVSDVEKGMEWLWDSTAKPVLESLGLLQRHDLSDELPSIWWVGGGSMALVPMHAAGHHHSGSTENTISHAISSYTPSLKVMQYSRGKVWKPLRSGPGVQKPKVVVVEMPATPGYKGSLKTHQETQSIRQHIEKTASVEVLVCPSKARALEIIQDCAILHLARHAELNRTSSFQSALILGSGSRQERLTVDDLRCIDLHSAQIAYLSACSTAASSDRALINENIHLASTLLLAFRHVIGTLWDAYDEAAIEAAGNFYENLLCDGGTSTVPQALHRAVFGYRKKSGNSRKILHWGPFLHTGP